MRPWVALLLMGLALGAQAADLRKVEAEGLRLRAGPGADQPVRAHLKRGATVELLQAGEGAEAFCEIDAGGQRGFVACRFLSLVKTAAPAESPLAPPPYADLAPLLEAAREPWPLSADQALTDARGADMQAVRRNAEAAWTRTQQRAQTLQQLLGLESAQPEALQPWIALLREIELPAAQASFWRDAALVLAPASNATLGARLRPGASLWLHRWLREGDWRSEAVPQPPGCALLRPAGFALLTAQALPTPTLLRVDTLSPRIRRVRVDLDGDGQPDLLAWVLEPGPGGAGTVLVAANIEGVWKLLGRVRGSC